MSLASLLSSIVSTSDLAVGNCVRYYADPDGTPRADVYNPRISLSAPGCFVARRAMPIRAPSKMFDPATEVIDPTIHPPVLIVRQGGPRPAILLDQLIGPKVPFEAPTQEHESQSTYQNDPELEDDVVSDNGGSRLAQKKSGVLAATMRGDMTFQFLNGRLVIGGAEDPTDSAAIAGPLVELLQMLLDRLADDRQWRDSVNARVSALESWVRTGAVSAGGGPLLVAGVGLPPGPGTLSPAAEVTYDLATLKSKLIRVSREVADD